MHSVCPFQVVPRVSYPSGEGGGGAVSSDGRALRSFEDSGNCLFVSCPLLSPCGHGITVVIVFPFPCCCCLSPFMIICSL